jgi:hypothetical protein
MVCVCVWLSWPQHSPPPLPSEQHPRARTHNNKIPHPHPTPPSRQSPSFRISQSCRESEKSSIYFDRGLENIAWLSKSSGNYTSPVFSSTAQCAIYFIWKLDFMCLNTLFLLNLTAWFMIGVHFIILIGPWYILKPFT